MPADDTVNGPFGALRFDGLKAADGTVLPEFVVPVRFVGDDPGFLQYSTPQVVVTATSPCAISSGSPCQPYTVRAGGALTLTVPTGSRLDALGLGGLGAHPLALAVSLQPVDAAGTATGAPIALATSGSGTVTVSVPASTAAGLYRLTVVNGDSGDTYGPLKIAETRIQLQVTARNRGLASHTDWNDHAEESGGGMSPLVPVGAGLVLAAGATAAVVLRRRTVED
jgi:hypothetical protein